MASKPGLKAVELFDAVRAGKIKALWIMATNPAVSMPNSSHIAEALKACPFVVVSDVTANTETAEYAHVLLPAMGWGEKDGTVTNSERRISRQRQLTPAAGEAKADWRIMCDVAQQMGFTGFNFETPAEVFAEHAALTGVLNDGRRTLDLTAMLGQDYNELLPKFWGGSHPFADGQFETSDRKARFVATPVSSVGHIESKKYTLNTGRIRDQWHTMTRTGLVPKLYGHRAEPYVEISPTDAANLNMRDAELALVEGANGASVLRVLVTEAVLPGDLFQPMHWSNTFASASKANAATRGITDPFSGQPALKSGQVTIKQFPARWFGFGVMQSKCQPAFDYWALRPLANGQSFECAGLEQPHDWYSLLGQLIDLGDPGLDVSTLTSLSTGTFRCAVTRNKRLELAFFASTKPVETSRHWLQQLLGTEVELARILAGRPTAAVADIGPIVCACNGIGRNQISSAVLAMPGASLHSICEATKAGMGCGSCRPEIQRIINGTPIYAQAAE
jgi:assimilatory nitrate reductase catalytic subunit